MFHLRIECSIFFCSVNHTFFCYHTVTATDDDAAAAATAAVEHSMLTVIIVMEQTNQFNDFTRALNTRQVDL